jgi:hypothetical protein|tara:strand:+ start:13570 stop:14634 length:1065 start_codon:yes stop_codon:yes gene_type:complete
MVELTAEQRESIRNTFKVTQDLIEITKNVFKNEDLDGRSQEGRAVRDFLVSEGMKYNTTKSTKKTNVELTDSQKSVLMSNQVSSSMTALEIARVVFQTPDVKSLDASHRSVIEFLEKFRPDVIDSSAKAADGKWHSPKSHSMAIRRCNKWCATSLKENPDELPAKQRKNTERLLEYLNIHKLITTVNAYRTDADRDLFESEFVRATWDKPDLTTDELNLYMMICSNFVRAKHIQNRMDIFTDMLENEELESQDINMRLTEHIKATNDELNACEKRIESLTQKLNGDRAKKLEKKGENTQNILSLVEAFQDEEERQRLVMMAEQRLSLVEKEADRLESLDEYKARIFGTSKEELL